MVGGMQKYCPKCSKPAVMEIARKQSMDHYKANRSEINPDRNARRRIAPVRACAVCGREFAHGGKRILVCSDKCRRIDKNRKWNEWRKNKQK